MLVLAGNMSFLDMKIDGRHEANVYGHVKLELPETYDLEMLLNTYDAYLVPSHYTGKIVFIKHKGI